MTHDEALTVMARVLVVLLTRLQPSLRVEALMFKHDEAVEARTEQ